MLEVEEGVRVLECRVVDPRQVPDHVVAEPERERHRRMGQHPEGFRPDELRRERGREAEDDEERRPLGEDDVLQEVDRQQVVHGDRLERRDRHEEEQRHCRHEADDAPPRSGEAAHGEDVRDREQRNDDERLGVPRPRVRVHAATLIAARA